MRYLTCVSCGRDMRPTGTRRLDHPSTVEQYRETTGACRNCVKRDLRLAGTRPQCIYCDQPMFTPKRGAQMQDGEVLRYRRDSVLCVSCATAEPEPIRTDLDHLPALEPSDPYWYKRAACTGLAPMFDADAPVVTLKTHAAQIRTCHACPVAHDCLLTALREETRHGNPEITGIRGGLLPAERKEIIKRHHYHTIKTA